MQVAVLALRRVRALVALDRLLRLRAAHAHAALTEEEEDACGERERVQDGEKRKGGGRLPWGYRLRFQSRIFWAMVMSTPSLVTLERTRWKMRSAMSQMLRRTPSSSARSTRQPGRGRPRRERTHPG